MVWASRLLVLVLVAVALLGRPAGAQEPDTTTTSLVVIPTPDIVPKPNSGEEPDDAGDRGGVLQLTVLLLVAGAITTCVLLVVRQSRHARAERPSASR